MIPASLNRNILQSLHPSTQAIAGAALKEAEGLRCAQHNRGADVLLVARGPAQLGWSLEIKPGAFGSCHCLHGQIEALEKRHKGL